jgi:putative protease
MLNEEVVSDTAKLPRPELLAPAGDWEALRAAVANGADAVYFGLSAFNARHRATNFSLEELPEVIEYLHAHNVRGYVALNVLIFSDELPAAVNFVKAVAAARADAVIVQDLGLARLIHRLAPSLPIHGSTQMTLTEPLGVEFVRNLGISRVILARELSATDIGLIHQATQVPLEVFVHGALCVAYSGQCLTSEALGGRSANRGQCAQACRLPYDLVVDGAARDLGDKAYLLSPQDLAAYDLIDDLAKRGVVSFKIEGRLKSAQYVAATTQTYRDAIDAAVEGHAFSPTRQQEDDLAQSFSRGFTHGFLDGVDHQKLVHARFPKSRGIRAGKVIGRTDRGIVIRAEIPPARPGQRPQPITLKPGDGVVFDDGHPDQDEQGGRIVEVIPHDRASAEIVFHRRDMNLSAIADGSIVWKTDDPQIRRRLEHSYSRDRVARRVPLEVRVTASVGKNLSIEAIDDAGHRFTVNWDRQLELAQKFPMTLEIFREQFGRLGETPFDLGEVFINGQPESEAATEFPPVMIPKSVLNDLRRQAVAGLLQSRSHAADHAIVDADALASLRSEIAMGRERIATSAPGEKLAANEKLAASEPIGPREASQPDGTFANRASSETVSTTPQMHILVRSMDQLEAVTRWKPAIPGMHLGTVYCEFEDIRRYPDAVRLARSSGLAIALATVRIIKPTEQGLLRQVAQADPDYILVRNLAGLSFYRENFPRIPLLADYSLNVANELTAQILLEANVRRITPSYDLNWKQLSMMAARFPAQKFEAVIHQHMPMFHMEHCVFAHTLSNGKDFRDCGRPCEKHAVNLADRAGVQHPLLADVGCRNTVYNGTAQSGAEFVSRMKEIGIAHFRIELLRESPAEAADLFNRYAGVIAGVEDGRSTWKQLKVLNQLGVTRGTLE